MMQQRFAGQSSRLKASKKKVRVSTHFFLLGLNLIEKFAIL